MSANAWTKTSPCRQPGYVPQYKHRDRIVGAKDSCVVQASAFKAILEPLIEKHNVEADVLINEETGELGGGLELICHRASSYSKKPVDKYLRRLYDVRNGKVRSLAAETADEVLLGAGVTWGNSQTDCAEGLMSLPVGLPAAKDKIEAKAEMLGMELREEEVFELALDLLEFSYVVVHDTQNAVNGNVEELPAALTQLALEAA